MNPEAQRIAIAEACGWTEIEDRLAPLGGPVVLSGKPPQFKYVQAISDYLNDLNAMHEAEKMLTPAQQYGYWSLLCDIAGNMVKGASSTAAQRAEAFLRTYKDRETDKAHRIIRSNP